MKKLLILLSMLFILGCGAGDKMPKSTIKIIGFGDSITKATFYAVTAGYLQRVHDYLEPIYRFTAVDMSNQGVDGNTSTDGVNRVNADVVPLCNSNTIVFMQFGTNDVNKTDEINCDVPIATFEANIRSLVSTITGTGATLILMCPPPVDEAVDPGNRYNTDIEAYGNKIKLVASDNSLTVIDHYTRWMSEADYTTLLGDGRHPNDDGYIVMTDEITDNVDFKPVLEYATLETTDGGVLIPLFNAGDTLNPWVRKFVNNKYMYLNTVETNDARASRIRIKIADGIKAIVDS